MSRRRWIATLAGLLLLTGCTTIPTSSSPQVVRTLNRGSSGSPAASIVPEPGDDPREVVIKFVDAAVQAGAAHSASRQFLSTAAARKWQDNSAVILDGEPGIGLPTPDGADRAIVVVSGNRIGQLDSAGVYTPTLKNPSKGDLETFSYRLVKTSGQWRIDQLPPGVLVGRTAFESSFPANTLYFLNSAADTSQLALVPDLRYTSLTGQAQASWLLTQLLAGPRAELAQSVASEVPDQVGKATVQLGDPIMVEIPGTSQLDGAGRNALAAQLAYTFYTFEYGGAQLTITDGGRPVRIPAAVGTAFSENNFNVNPPSSANVYYLLGGAVIDGSDGTALPGLLGQPNQLDSVAIRASSSGSLLAAGVRQGSLLVGTDRKLTKVPLPAGELSRPEWRPHAQDAWVGVGDHGAIYRVVPGTPAKPVSITSPVAGSLTGQVLALRFSSDGVRIAAAVRAPDGSSAAWVGSVVTSGTDIRIDSFEPVTPAQLVVSDVAWADETRLSVLASSTDSPGAAAQVWRINTDGSHMVPIPNTGLAPGSPSAIAEQNGQTLASLSGNIWAHASETAGQWTYYPATRTSPQPGTNPIFAE